MNSEKDHTSTNEKKILTQLHIDALQELGNIGAAHSATALSQLLNRKVDMSVPRVELVPIELLYKRVTETPDEPVGAVVSQTQGGEGSIDILITFTMDSMKRIIRVFTDDVPQTIHELKDFHKELLKEVGNILILHAVTAMNTFIEMTLYPTVPEFKADMSNAILQSLITKNEQVDYMISVECDIFTEGIDNIKGIVFLFPDRREMDKLMTHLYGEGWDQLDA